MGAALVAVGLAAAGTTSGFPQSVIVAAIAGLRIGIMGPTIIIVLMAKGSVRLRGTSIGALPLLGTLGVMPLAIESIVGPAGRHFAGFSAAAVFGLLGIFLYKTLPLVFPSREGPTASTG